MTARTVGDDRVLITGATGWLGRTALDLIAPLKLPMLALASRSRLIRVNGQDIVCEAWDAHTVAAFAPTIVVDCAFLTKGFAGTMPLAEYVAANRSMTDRLLNAANLPSVRLVVTISSGAAVYPRDALLGPIEDNPYGYLKREAETMLSEAATQRGVVPVIARAWSISGAHVQNPRGYALASMIQDAKAGEIHIVANREVYRRYVLAEELLAVAIAEGSVGPAVVDSGGPLVEMGELAAHVAAVVCPDARITRGTVDPVDPDAYHSDGTDWDFRCSKWGLKSASLDDQIALTARGVLPET